MISQPDKLFRNKIENFQLQAPVAAWKRIEAGLDKTSYKWLWMKIAAGLLLLSVAAFILWPTNTSISKQQLTNINNATPKTEGVRKTNSETIVPSVTSEQDIVQKNVTPKNRIVEKVKPVLVTESNEAAKENISVPIIEPTEIVPLTQVAVIVTNSDEPTVSRTIVYSAEEVNLKYLRKKLPIEATTEAKKTSGIQKLMGLAYNLKNTDSGLGDLRQKKDEILALNFLNEDKIIKRKN